MVHERRFLVISGTSTYDRWDKQNAPYIACLGCSLAFAIGAQVICPSVNLLLGIIWLVRPRASSVAGQSTPEVSLMLKQSTVCRRWMTGSGAVDLKCWQLCWNVLQVLVNIFGFSGVLVPKSWRGLDEQ
jgi:hypothetical protein